VAIEPLELTERKPPTRKLTFEEFMEWHDGTWAEWVDGEVIMASPASMQHQLIGSLIEKILSIYVETHDLGLVFRAPFSMRLREVARLREPDLIFVRKDRAHLLTKTYLDGPANLAVEIISPESIGRDRGEKFVEYERVGIKEYWLIDPERQTAEFYELGSDGRYHPASLESGIYHSQVVPGFWLRVEWLWQSPQPPTLELLRELKVL